ncbi:TIR domain-containing protein [Labilibaculum sp. A4]|uniref:toll/interleukin-1 receptor domain-containing protein n=1 Tax=Labilibaculum euxinus TaxID=2686357 RepID=UPI000F61B9B0|nr:toll/interleukin-1 receptor domain-containing protein [Labilibaculum euxinus]MDQ1770769.1 toll/interleukin-1 receptor domain-containing protein [Labilibaculum euxinus]MWN75939.1 TIR domain-containing protein [Labilibaculum euxinus]
MNSTNQNKNEAFFLSYAIEDISVVKTLYDKLKAKNQSVWFDRESLTGGQEWSDKIARVIKNSKAVIICLSKKSVDKEGFYQREIKHALECAKEKPFGATYIIPVMLEECSIPQELERFHCIRYFEKDGFNKLLKTLNSLSENRFSKTSESYILLSSLNETLNHNCIDGIAPWSNYAGSEIAVLLSPIVRPAYLKKVKFFVTDDEEPNTEFKVNIYEVSHNRPGEKLNKFDIIGKDGNGNKWVEIDISEHKIFISEGDFFVSMEWLKAPGENGDYSQYLLKKDNPVEPGKTFLKFGNDSKWWKKNSFNCYIHAIDSLGNEIKP